MEQQEQQAQEQQAQAPIGLTLQDLRVLAGAVELGAQRGAYRAGEMEVVGATYNKLATFLAANAPAQPEAPAEGAEVTETAETAE
jgi:hypothetical protein